MFTIFWSHHTTYECGNVCVRACLCVLSTWYTVGSMSLVTFTVHLTFLYLLMNRELYCQSCCSDFIDNYRLSLLGVGKCCLSIKNLRLAISWVTNNILVDGISPVSLLCVVTLYSSRMLRRR